jgi:hypothetical protein
MNYWRMQLHPCASGSAAEHATQSLAAGFIGLDFHEDCGDLSKANPNNIAVGQKDYLQFWRDMGIGDKVLIIVHHFPFALVEVAGEYNYIRNTEPEIGVWFRHFRRVKNVKYYSDFKTNAASWVQIRMTDTISILWSKDSKSYKLIEDWK